MWKGLVFIAGAFVLALATSCAKAGPPMSMKGVREAYAAEVGRRLPEATITVVADDQLAVADGKGHEINAYLYNDYGAYRQDPGRLQEVVKGSVAASIAATEPREIAAGTLLVLVRPTDYVQKQLFRPGDTGAPLPILSRPIAGDLVEIVAADQLLAYRFPPGPELRAALRTDDAGVWALTLANLRDTLADPDLTSRQVVTLHTGGLASSYLAEPELWDSPPMQVGGAPVVAPIGRDLVLVTHERDAKGIADMRKQAREMQRDPEALSDRLFVRRYGAWIELDPPPDRTRRR